MNHDFVGLYQVLEVNFWVLQPLANNTLGLIMPDTKGIKAVRTELLPS